MATDTFFQEYTSQDAIAKYSKATAGYGISYLLEHDYRKVYLSALQSLTPEVRQSGIRILEFGCGAGMNILHLVSTLSHDGINVKRAIGTDFSPVLIEEATHEASRYLPEYERKKVDFCVANNDSLIADLSAALKSDKSTLQNSFEFVLGVNTIRYSHRTNKELACARDLFDLLVPGGVCVVIDMNDRFPFFRSALKTRLRGRQLDQSECYLPSLDEYTKPFQTAGFEVLRSEHFCWIPHSSGALLCSSLQLMTPILNTVARSRAMRSLVIAKKPADA